tara:strand:- start:1068 stop:1913 length:846 start_codon:yes stop_codon:yes gene_type:complete
MEIIVATFAIALLSLVGMFFFGEKGHLTGTHRFIVPFAVGAFLAITFFELIPETLAASEFYGSVAIIGGFLLFYLVSNILHTYHHHQPCQDEQDQCSATRVTALLLLCGDFVHNITDGIVIASAFLVNPTVGWVTALGVALHEIPQEIAEFGVLRSAGYSRTRAAVLNFISASGVFVGALGVVVFAAYFSEYLWVLLGVAAGNLLYIAASDLLPGIHRESHVHGTFIGAFVATLLGVVTIGTLVGYSNMYFENDESNASKETVPAVRYIEDDYGVYESSEN